jgi:hypothetical protein
MRDRPDVILMTMCQHETQNVVADLLEKSYVGHHQIDAGRRGLAAKNHAAVDDDPTPLLGRTIAVAIEIHADLPCPAQREEDEIGAHWIVRHRRP